MEDLSKIIYFEPILEYDDDSALPPSFRGIYTKENPLDVEVLGVLFFDIREQKSFINASNKEKVKILEGSHLLCAKKRSQGMTANADTVFSGATLLLNNKSKDELIAPNASNVVFVPGRYFKIKLLAPTNNLEGLELLSKGAF